MILIPNSNKKVVDDALASKADAKSLNDYKQITDTTINQLKETKADLQITKELIADAQLQGAGVDTSTFAHQSDLYKKANASSLQELKNFTRQVISEGTAELFNESNLILDPKIKQNSLWGFKNTNCLITEVDGKISNVIEGFKKIDSSISAVISTEIPFSSFVNGNRYRISFDCGETNGTFKISLRENKGVIGQSLNRFILAETLMIIDGKSRYLDFTFSNENHTDGYNYLELQIILQSSFEYNISNIYIGTVDEKYSYIYELNSKLSQCDIELNHRKDSVISNFNSTTEWQAVNLSQWLNEDEKLTGKSTLFVECAAGVNGVLQLTKELNLRENILSISDYCEDISNITSCTIMMSIDDTTFSNKTAYYSISVTQNVSNTKTWLTHTITPLDWHYSGGATINDLERVKKIRISIRCSSNGGCKIGFDNLAMYSTGNNKGSVVFLFDDARKNIFLNVMPAFDKYGYCATTYVITDYVGTTTSSGAEFMTLKQLRILRDKGWTIGSHTKNHVHLSTIGIQEAEEELKGSHDWLVSNGFKCGSMHLAYPFGETNAEVKEITRKYFDTAFVTTEKWFAGKVVDKMAIPRFSIVKQKYTIDQFKEKLKVAKDEKQTLIVYLHNIGTEGIGVATEDWSAEEFQQIIDYIHEIDLSVISLADLAKLCDYNTYDAH